MTYKIVAWLKHRGDMISASAGVFHLTEPKKDAELEYEAASLIQELGEALETASARLKRLETRLPELLTGTQRAEMAIFAGHSADAIDAILSKLKDES